MDKAPIAPIDITAEMIGLQIPVEYRSGVLRQFARLADMAEQLMSFPLSDQEEPATVMRHE